MQKNKLIVVIIASFAVIASAWLLSLGIKQFRSGSPLISVTGMAERNIKSDLIVWTIDVSALSPNQEIAYNEHQKNRDEIIKYLISNGITQDQIRYSSTNVSNEYDQYYDDNTQKYLRTFKGVQLSSEIIVSSNDVDNVEIIYQKISELLKQGVNFVARAPRYYYT
ncbi:MAG: SIMPL domain-containing protein [Porphyromonadaceae bacterium]|nr:SIMPL domain-containing protein [Porphyromonadaceae bacterium]